MVNAALLVIIVLVWFILGYLIYGKFIERKIKPNDRTKTPAVTKKDGIDYAPASQPFLLGHHFASIAGAGPVIGPILAISYFGWLPVVLWIALGSVFIGAMHDYLSLIVSVRNKGKGVANITKDYLGKKSGLIFGIMILIMLILIITVFSVSAAESISNKPQLIIPLITITLVSLIVGFLVEKLKWNYKLLTCVAIIIISLSLWFATIYQINFLLNQTTIKILLITIIMGYATLASVLPVWVLLRPRDYLSAIQMLLIIALGFISILITQPTINAPHYIASTPFPLWPILFITVACGAVSGFHGLVSSGITSKQLTKESHGRSIGYGGMLLESVLALLVITVVIAGISWTDPQGFHFTLQKGWIILFATGFGNLVGSLGIPLITTTLAGLLGAFMVNQFILTSIDSSTRLSRFVLSENLFPRLKNRFLTAFIIIVPAWILAITNSYQSLWRLFGSSNQLIAAITLITITSYFVQKKMKVTFILLPALFVLITTVAALAYMIFRPQGFLQTGNIFLTLIATTMMLLGVIIGWKGLRKLQERNVRT